MTRKKKRQKKDQDTARDFAQACLRGPDLQKPDPLGPIGVIGPTTTSDEVCAECGSPHHEGLCKDQPGVGVAVTEIDPNFEIEELLRELLFINRAMLQVLKAQTFMIAIEARVNRPGNIEIKKMADLVTAMKDPDLGSRP